MINTYLFGVKFSLHFMSSFGKSKNKNIVFSFENLKTHCRFTVKLTLLNLQLLETESVTFSSKCNTLQTSGTFYFWGIFISWQMVVDGFMKAALFFSSVTWNACAWFELVTYIVVFTQLMYTVYSGNSSLRMWHVLIFISLWSYSRRWKLDRDHRRKWTSFLKIQSPTSELAGHESGMFD